MKHIQRGLASRIETALKVNPVVFVNGPRQAGKSTLVQSLSKGAKYVSFDQPVQMAIAANSPQEFLRNSIENRLIIDEVQMVPEIFRAIKIIVDEMRYEALGKKSKPNVNGKFILTGSANILALPKLSDALVGRMSVLTLYPFTTSEAINSKNNPLNRIFNLDFAEISKKKLSMIEAIKLASFPEVAFASDSQRFEWFNGYITSILQRDVRMIADLEKISMLPNLLRILANRAGSLINETDIARDVGLNAITGKFYRTILKMMFLNFDISPWRKNLNKRLVKASKGYIYDTMLLCHMLDFKIEDIKQKRPEIFGHVVENYVASELTKLISYSDIGADLMHFRTSEGKEVDFVIQRHDGKIFAIEVKSAESVSADDFNGLKLLAELTKSDFLGGIVLYSGKEVVPFAKNMWAVPMSVLW